MRILVLGGTGMIGHHLLRQWQPRHDVRATVRGPLSAYAMHGFFTERHAFPNVDVLDTRRLREVFHTFRPEVIVNAVGIVKQVITPALVAHAEEVNARFPHVLAACAATIGARVIQLSSDCVFRGTKGMYVEEDPTDANDVYGKTKAAGELISDRCLTLRKSVIGEELATSNGLLEWFLHATGTVKGFTRAIYSGLTIIEFCRIVERLIVEFPHATGVYHVSSDPISKHELLCLIKEHFRCSTVIVPDDTVVCDRSLNSVKCRTTFGYTPPSWPSMIRELAAESRRHH